jgi:hypothetical protein
LTSLFKKSLNSLADKAQKKTHQASEVKEKLQKSVKQKWERHHALVPPLFFIAGCLIDIFTLGRVVLERDMWILLAYFTGASLFLTLNFRYKNKKLQWGLDFCIGALFSAMSVLYFKSSGNLGGLFFALIIVAGLFLNEFRPKREENNWIHLCLYFVSICLYFNFMIPHFAKSVHAAWFFVSVFASFMLTHLWVHLGKKRKSMLILPGFFAAFLVTSYQMNWIPPVPLILKESHVGLKFQKNGYSVLSYQQGWLSKTFDSPEVHWQNGQRVYYINSVFAPEKVKATLEHRWWFYNKDSSAWIAKDTLELQIKDGGRKNGWRLYSYKQNIKPGLWKVETALIQGAGLGNYRFEVKHEELDLLDTTLWKRMGLK